MKKLIILLLTLFMVSCASINYLQLGKERKVPIIIEYINYYPLGNIDTSFPNSVGGIDVNIKWVNTSEKIIKYISFYVTPYNAVNDVQECEIRNINTANLGVTGPIGEEQKKSEWSCVWYNNTIKYSVLEKVRIEYMNNTIITISKEELNKTIYKKSIKDYSNEQLGYCVIVLAICLPILLLL